MKLNTWICFLGTAFALSGCVPMQHGTLGETSSGYTYVPVGPFAVDITNAIAGVSNLLSSLPDNAVRVSVEQFDAKGNVTYGPAGVSVKGGRYRTTVDYINTDTTTIKLFIARSVLLSPTTNSNWGGASGISNRPARPAPEFQWLEQYRPKNSSLERQWLTPDQPLPKNAIIGSESYWVSRVSTTNDTESSRLEFIRGGNFQRVAVKQSIVATPNGELLVTEASQNGVGAYFDIPIYIGIGLRVSADIRTYESGLSVSGLSTIGANAEAKRLSGSLVVQTLGVNGKSISAALPIQSELNQTTAQNAIVAVGAIKALLYERETAISPRVVGLQLPFAGGKALVNAIMDELVKHPIVWQPVPAATK